MAKTDWDSIAKLFAIESERTGVSAKEWCEQNGYNYQSARRYLKTRSQSPTQTKTSRVAAQSGTKKPKKSAQTAQKSVRKTNAQNKRAQSGKPNESAIEEESGIELATDTVISDCDAPRYKGRDELGRFLKGEYEGNPNPPHHFPEGHKYSTKHGGYASLLKEDDLAVADESELLGLIAERRLFRARIASALRTIQETEAALTDPETLADPEKVIAMQRLIKSAGDSIERSAIRVESLTKTISSIRIDDINVPRLTTDTAKIKAQTGKLKAETDKLGRKSTAESVTYQFDW